MELQKQNVPIIFQGGVDSKTDPKLLPPTKLTALSDAVWSKTGTIKTRPGQEELSNSNYDSVTFDSGQGIAALLDEVLRVYKNSLYSFDDTANKWISRGIVPNYGRDISTVINNFYGKCTADAAYLSGYELYVWYDQRGDVRCTAIDTLTGVKVLVDQQVSSAGRYPRVAKTANYIFILYVDGTTLKGRRFSPAAPTTLETEFTVKAGVTPVVGTHSISLSDSVTVGGSFSLTTDIVYTGSSAAGYEVRNYDSGAIVILWKKSATDDFGLFYLKEDKTIASGAPYAAEITYSAAATSGAHVIEALAVQPSTGDVYIVIGKLVTASTARLTICAYNANLTSKLAETTIETIACRTSDVKRGFNRTGVAWSDGTTLQIYSECDGLTTAGGIPRNNGEDVWIRRSAVTAAGVVTNYGFIFYHCMLACEPFLATTGFYIGLIYRGWESKQSGATGNHSLQGTLMVVDISGNYLGKIRQGQSWINGEDRTWPVSLDTTRSFLPRVTEISTDNFLFPIIKANIEAHIGSRGPYQDTGIEKIVLDFSTANSLKYQKAHAPSNVYFGGAGLCQYDGNYAVEHGFDFYPDSLGVVTTAVTKTVTQQGDGSHAETTDITFVPGFRIRNGDYITLYYSGGSMVFVFQVDGYPIDTSQFAASTTVSIYSYYNASEVGAAFATVVDADSHFAAVNVAGVVTVTNSVNAAVTDAVVSTITAGNIDASGTYNYRAVWKWTDESGLIHRSAPSPALTVENGSATSVGIYLPALQFTRKGISGSKVYLELYRTTDGGTTYYKISELGNSQNPYQITLFDPPLSHRGVPWAGWCDTADDDEIVTQEILYTTGGTIENIAPPAPRAFLVARNRALLIPEESPNEVWISKQFEEGFGIQFSDLLKVPVEQVGGECTALGVIDEKYLIFKEAQTRFIFGDGPNDLGNGQFSNPEIISPDKGCPYPESVTNIPDGVMFKSKKGWQLIDRALQVSYIGGDIEELNTLTVARTLVLEDQHVALIFHTDGSCAMYEYDIKQWSYHSNKQFVDATTNGNDVYGLKSNGKVWKVTPATYVDPSSGEINMSATTAWIKIGSIQGFQRVRRLIALGLFPEGHDYTVRVYYDYKDDDYDEYNFAPAVDVNCIQRITFSAVATAGAWKVTFNGQETGSLAYNINAAALETALELLSSIDDVTVTGSVSAGFTIEFTGATDGAKPQNLMTVSANTLAISGVDVDTYVNQSQTGYTAKDEKQFKTPKLTRQKCQAIKIQLIDDQNGTMTASELTSFEAEVGLKKGLRPQPPINVAAVA